MTFRPAYQLSTCEHTYIKDGFDQNKKEFHIIGITAKRGLGLGLRLNYYFNVIL